MSIQTRVPDAPDVDDYEGDYAIVRRRGGFAIYEDATHYSPNAGGQVIALGAVVRRYDPDAGGAEGKPARFSTLDEARSYVRRWLK